MALLNPLYTAPLPAGFTSGTVEIKSPGTYVDQAGRVQQPSYRFSINADGSLTSLQVGGASSIVGMGVGDRSNAPNVDVVIELRVAGSPVPFRTTYNMVPFDSGSGTLRLQQEKQTAPVIVTASVISNLSNQTALYVMGTENISIGGTSLAVETFQPVAPASTAASVTAAATAAVAPVKSAINNLLLTDLALKAQADGAQFVDGSRWVWAASGTADNGLIVAAATTGVWVRQFQIVTPQMFGGKGDGTTNDQAALMGALASGYDVYLSNKTWFTSPGLTVAAGQRLYGGSAGTATLLIGGLSAGQYGVDIQGTDITGSPQLERVQVKRHASSSAAAVAVKLRGNFSRLRDVRIDDSSLPWAEGAQFSGQNCYITALEGCIIRYNGVGVHFPVIVSNSGERMRLRACTLGNNGYNLLVDDRHQITLEDCSLDYPTIAQVGFSANKCLDMLIISGGHIEHTNTAIPVFKPTVAGIVDAGRVIVRNCGIYLPGILGTGMTWFQTGLANGARSVIVQQCPHFGLDSNSGRMSYVHNNGSAIPNIWPSNLAGLATDLTNSCGTVALVNIVVQFTTSASLAGDAELVVTAPDGTATLGGKTIAPVNTPTGLQVTLSAIVPPGHKIRCQGSNVALIGLRAFEMPS